MLEWVRGAFRGFFSFTLWLCLIACAISGAVIGYGVNGVGFAILGLILGILVGLIIVIICGGIVATILNIDENLQLLLNNSYKSGSATNTTSLRPQESIPTQPPPINKNYGDTWTCKKCNDKNPNTSLTCKGCGEYK